MTQLSTRAANRRMPRQRVGHTTSVTIGGERFCLTANAREDGSLGEVSVSSGKHGHALAGLTDAYATALSIGLAHGVPLIDLVRQGLGLLFVPSGRTDDPDFPRVGSVADWVARRLAVDWLPFEARAREGILTVDERVAAAEDWLTSEDAQNSGRSQLASEPLVVERATPSVRPGRLFQRRMAAVG
jgi:ribonucleoside-diphosphate reductase alpha chain